MTTAAATHTAVSVRSILNKNAVGASGKALGPVEDVVVRLRGERSPLLTGFVIKTGEGHVVAPTTEVTAIDSDPIQINAIAEQLPRIATHADEVLLKEDVLEHRLIDLDRIVLVNANDVLVTRADEGWVVAGVDVHKQRWFQFGSRENSPLRDWHDFLLLRGRELPSGDVSKIRRLKPAQIADLIESASGDEQDLLLAHLRGDPELEADVFEELDDNSQSRLLRARADKDIADVLSRMRADDAADAIMELPQERRRTILELLPKPQNTKVLTLLGYNDATAGGLMGTDYLALSEESTIAEALQRVREATTQQPEALTTIYSLSSEGTLSGTLGIIRALQSDPTTVLRNAAEHDIVVASPEDDLIAVATRMADFNLLNLPVVDPEGRILGVITVDDALEAAIPRDWSQREPSHLKRMLRAGRSSAEMYSTATPASG